MSPPGTSQGAPSLARAPRCLASRFQCGSEHAACVHAGAAAQDPGVELCGLALNDCRGWQVQGAADGGQTGLFWSG